MSAGDLAILAWCDLGAILRTRPVLLEQLESKRRYGVGWAAAGFALTPFNGIVDNPFGPLDELRQIPVDGASITVPAAADVPAMHLILTRTLDVDGRPADFCPRNFCQAAMEALERETGLSLWIAFEHEFTVMEAPFRLGPGFGVESLRLAARFAHDVTQALRPLGVETFEPEFGKGQFEVSCTPCAGASGPDQAVMTREVIREIARRHAIRLTFAPKPFLDSAGNGMHIHFSFKGADGHPTLYDATRPATLSAQAASFVAGVLRHMDAITALSAPTPGSYLRLGPGHWSCGYAAFGVQNREAALRVCPSPNADPVAAAAATNLEIRVPDGTCNPYLAVGGLTLAGLQGIRERLPLPPIVNRDPEALSATERDELQVRPLPASLNAALAALERDPIARRWLPPRLHEVFMTLKRMEIARFSGVEPELIAAAYRDLY